MKRTLLILIVVTVLAVLVARSVVFVDESEMVIITQFGRPLNTCREAGLRWKLPYQSAIRIDRRLQIYDPSPSEFLAAQKKNLDLDVFVCWRVKDPQRFLETVSDFTGAEFCMHDIVWSELATEVGSHPIEALVSTEADVHQLDQIQEDVAARCAARAEREFGIEIVDVRLKRISLPDQVRESVFQRMRAERARIARQYRAEGEKEAQIIRSTAQRERTELLAEAEKKAQGVRGQAEAEATRHYAAAHAQDPEFYELLRKLEAYRKILDDQTTLLLRTDSELFDVLVDGQRSLGPAPTTEE